MSSFLGWPCAVRRLLLPCLPSSSPSFPAARCSASCKCKSLLLASMRRAVFFFCACLLQLYSANAVQTRRASLSPRLPSDVTPKQGARGLIVPQHAFMLASSYRWPPSRVLYPRSHTSVRPEKSFVESDIAAGVLCFCVSGHSLSRLSILFVLSSCLYARTCVPYCVPMAAAQC